MAQIDVVGVIIEATRGDIARQDDVEAVVNAANAQLGPGGGVAGAIHRAAGPSLAQEAQQYAPLEPGQAVTTGAHGLPNDYVIHCLGPVYGRDEPADELLSACYRNALREADRHHITTIAFPAISTGAFGYPIDDAAPIAVDTVAATVPGHTTISLVRFVLFGQDDQDAFDNALHNYSSS